MRENCTYGSMRGRAHPTGASRSTLHPLKTDDLAVGDIPEWDSLHHMMIITGLQKEFGVEFQREELIDIENVADLVALVEEKTKK